MKLKISLLLAASLLMCAQVLAQRGVRKGPIKDHYIVQMKESFGRPLVKVRDRSTRDRQANFRAKEGARKALRSKLQSFTSKYKLSSREVRAVYTDAVVGFTAKLTPSQMKAIQSDPAVSGIWQDFWNWIAPEPSRTSQKKECGIDKAGGFRDGSGKYTWIWILDTGMDMNHPDLNVMTNSQYAKSFISGETVEDGNGHGTHCAGIAAAKNNSFGVVGVSAGARVVPVKVLGNSGSGSWSALLSGLDHVAMYDIPGDVVNLSLGAYPVSCSSGDPDIQDAILNLGSAGTFVVIAAGNDSGNATLQFPGCISGTNVFTIGAIECDNDCYSNGNWGAPPIDYVAVGVSVYSTDRNGGYTSKTGTSMATPHVAGIIHARGGAPASGGTVQCGNRTYTIAKR